MGTSRCFYPRKQLQAALQHPLLPPADVDKCQRKPRLCKGRSICINTQGNYTCRCPPGLELNLSDPNMCSGRGPGRRCEAAPELGRGQAPGHAPSLWPHPPTPLSRRENQFEVGLSFRPHPESAERSLLPAVNCSYLFPIVSARFP